MKLILLAFCLIGWCQAFFLDESVIETCVKETGVDPLLLIKVRDGEAAPNGKVLDHLICTLKKSEIMDETGKINVDTAVSKLRGKFKDSGIEKKFMDECLVNKASVEETAKALLECAIKVLPKPN